MSNKLVSMWQNQPRIPIVVGALALGVGSAVGYIYGRNNKKQTVYNVGNTGQNNSGPTIRMEQSDPERVDTDMSKVIEFIESQGAEVHITETEEDSEGVGGEERHNVFAEATEDGWDYEAQVALRTPEAPYPIHRDEYFEDEQGFTQLQLTFYAGDRILADEDNQPIYNHVTRTGDLQFGFGTGGDPNVCYIRNEKLKAEYEVILDKGLFQVEVLGMDAEDHAEEQDLRHSSTPRRFRTD